MSKKQVTKPAKRARKGWFMAAVIFLVVFGYQELEAKAEANPEHEAVKFLERLYDTRADLLISRNHANIDKFYTEGTSVSNHARRVELKRTEYLQAWAAHKGIHFMDSASDIHIARMKVNGDTAKVTLTQSLKLSYIYLDAILPAQSFGIGTWHVLTLKNKNGQWFLYKEWYLDPLDENPKTIPEASGPNSDFTPHKDVLPTGKKYKREQAVAYADKYAGVAWGAGNNHHYNKKYLNYTGKGGDCTNFASQVVGDRVEGGGLKMYGGWRYFYKAGGSQKWVQTDAFKNFLVYSGYGRVLANGYYTDIVKPTTSYPQGAFSQMHPGDLIAHVLHGDVDHFSVITGFDAKGYPLVNSHTADRYHVPFDLGWDKYTKYILIHIND